MEDTWFYLPIFFNTQLMTVKIVFIKWVNKRNSYTPGFNSSAIYPRLKN